MFDFEKFGVFEFLQESNDDVDDPFSVIDMGCVDGTEAVSAVTAAGS